MAIDKVPEHKQEERDLAELASIDFDAQFPREMVRQMEDAARQAGMTRRIVLALLSQSKQSIVSNGAAMPPEERVNLWLEEFERVGEFIIHLNAQLEAAKAAQNRCMVLAATAATGEVGR